MQYNLKHIANKYIYRFKSLFSQFKYKNDDNYPSICDLGINNYDSFYYLKDNYETIRNEYIFESIGYLLDKNSIKWAKLPLYSYTEKTFVIDNHCFPNMPSNNINTEFMIEVECNGGKQVYFFKKFGFPHRISNKNLISPLSKMSTSNKIIYVDLVEKGAYLEVISHNNDDEDIYRGTDVVSVIDFLKLYCNGNDINEFISCCSTFTQKAKEYFDFKIVPSLQNPSLNNFKYYLSSQIKTFEYNKMLPLISEEQHSAIKKHYIDSRLYECLMGSSNFAKCFMTAEWLYSSLGISNNIDYTSIAMGYLKSIEQFLDLYISQFVNEIDPNTNDYYKLYLKKNLILPLSKEQYEKIRSDLTLGNLTNFFGYYNLKTDKLHYRNTSLLLRETDRNTYREVIKFLSQLSDLRNGYFHKDNITDWDTVEETRNTAFTTFYLIMGCYSLTSKSDSLFGFIRHPDSELYKLCEYLKNEERNNTEYVFSVYRVDNSSEWMIPVFEDVEYDCNGTPDYKVICFKSVGIENNRYYLQYTESQLPKTIEKGILEISKDKPGYSFINCNTCIFSNGKLKTN